LLNSGALRLIMENLSTRPRWLVQLGFGALAVARTGISILPTGSLPGTPIVRHYWHEFLVRHQSSIAGRALEIGSTRTLRRYGGTRLTSAEAVDLLPNPGVTYVADLTRAWSIPAERFDVFINQFTLHLIRDDLEALYHSLRLLRPGGVLLCNFPSFSGFNAEGQDFGTGVRSYVWRWYTPPGVRVLFDRLGLCDTDYELVTYGSFVGLLAYAMGIPAELLPRGWVARQESGRPLLICARVTKPVAWQPVWRPEPEES
jgi:SAM-dependent methyltransferase